MVLLRNTFLVLFAILSFNAYSQYSSDWIDLSKEHYKIPSTETGITRITYADLINSGVNLSGKDAEELQIFHRGNEQRIFFSGSEDGTFDSGDYIEFYSIGNDGTLDSLLYDNPVNQPHQYYNLYSDTTAYFITWRDTPGKRMDTSAYASSRTPINYHLQESLLLFTDVYSWGNNSREAYSSYYNKGEGWFGDFIGKGQNISYTINGLNNIYTGFGSSNLEVCVIGANNVNNITPHGVNIDIGSPVQTSAPMNDFVGYATQIQDFDTPTSQLLSGNLPVKISVVDGVFSDFIYTGYLKLTYPQTFNLSGKNEEWFNIPRHASDTAVIEFTNASGNYVLYDITNRNDVYQIQTTLNGTTLKAVITGTASGMRKLFLRKQSSFINPIAVKATNFKNYLSGNPDYLILSHRGFVNEIEEYANYRSSMQGGSYSTSIAYVRDIFDQFNYGEKSPLAIRKYAEYMYGEGSPEYLFIIGKGVTTNFKTGRRPYYRKIPNTDDRYGTKDLIPTWGVPGSDLLFTIGLDGQNSRYPAFPVSRLSAKSAGQISSYLEKIKAHDGFAYDELWRKNLIHLSGGFDSQAPLFLSYVNDFKAIAEDTLLGGKVKTFFKNSNGIEFFNVSEEVNAGVGLITFYGHSSADIADIDIGRASDDINGYANKDKYPFVFINGCNSGNMYDSDSWGEDWVLTPQKGSFGFLAHSDKGFVLQLKDYATIFYRVAFAEIEFFGESIGNIHKEVIRRFADTHSFSNLINQSQIQQMNLQGDPAASLYKPTLPDLYIEPNGLFLESFDPNVPVTAVSDSFRLGMIISNSGMAKGDSFTVCVTRTYNNGQTTEEFGPVWYGAVLNSDTLFFTIPSDNAESFGENEFTVKLDCIDSLRELRELNNEARLDYFMPISGTINIFPSRFSVLGSDTVTFLAQSTDRNASAEDYIFELDTVGNFENPLLRIERKAGRLPRWGDIILPGAEDSLVYYWRTRIRDVLPGGDTLWSNSSFMYIKDKTGWGQGDFLQFRSNGFFQTYQNPENEKFRFDTVVSRFIINSPGNGDALDSYWQLMNFRVNDRAYVIQAGRTGFQGCDRDALFMIAVSQVTTVPYHPDGVEAGNCGLQPRLVTSLPGMSSTSRQQAVIDYVNRVKPGDYVLFFTNGNVNYSSWSGDLLSLMQSLGSDSITSLQDGEPFIFMGQVGTGQKIFEKAGSSVNDIITVDQTLKGEQFYGEISSPLIGPASDWQYYYQDFTSVDSDFYEVELLGVNLSGSKTSLYAWSNVSDDFEMSLDGPELIVDAEVYPFLQLKAKVKDSVDFTPAQLRRWVLTYESVPEGIAYGDEKLLKDLQDSEINQGDEVTIGTWFENISDIDFIDPISVRYQITNENGKVITDTVEYSPLLSGDSAFYSYVFRTDSLQGKNKIQIFANPRFLPEVLYENNIIEFDLNVIPDDIHPVLDVVFDGRHILDGEIVSADPVITISLHDEESSLFKNDTIGMEIYLQRPCADPDPLNGCPFEQIYFGGSNILTWSTADENTPYRIEYKPGMLDDGVYTLSVQGTDAAGNKSASSNYRISFQVISKASITNFYPYPNPFSTSTRFVFTLTGAKVPQNIKIQIMTVSGRVVREINQDEIGPVRIGNNITEFAWDGTDEFGDRLANGVYLYRVFTELDGSQMDHRDTGGDKGFKRGFGKLTIIR